MICTVKLLSWHGVARWLLRLRSCSQHPSILYYAQSNSTFSHSPTPSLQFCMVETGHCPFLFLGFSLRSSSFVSIRGKREVSVGPRLLGLGSFDVRRGNLPMHFLWLSL
jgi:hypothetical protein